MSDSSFIYRNKIFGYRSICPKPIRPNVGKFVPVLICPRSICPNLFQNGYIFSSLYIVKKCVPYNFGCWDNLNIAVSLHFFFFLDGVICIFYSIPLLLLVWILVQQIQIIIRLKNKIILLCIEINLKTYKIY